MNKEALKLFLFLTVAVSYGLMLGVIDQLGKIKPQPILQDFSAVSELPSEEPAVFAGADEVDFKIYKNKKYGFEIEYPSSWSIYDGDAEDIFIQPSKEGNKKLPIPHDGAMEIKVSSFTKKITFLEAVNKAREDGIDFREEKIEIGGEEGWKVSTDLCRGRGCTVTEWFVVKDNYLYHFSSIYPAIAYSEFFDRMISSFKFIKD